MGAPAGEKSAQPKRAASAVLHDSCGSGGCPRKCVRLLPARLPLLAACRRTTRWDPWWMATGSGRSLARIDRNDLLRLAKLAADVEGRLFARYPHGAARYAGRLVCRALRQGPPSNIWTRGMASRTSTSGRSTPSMATGHSRIDGEERRITVRRNSGGIQITRRRTQAVASICSGDRSTFRLTPNRPRSSVTISFAARTRCAKALAAKAVALIHHEQLAGKVVWPEASPSQ